MIDQKQLDQHPVSQLALAELRRAGWTANPTTTPILRLLLAWLDSLIRSRKVPQLNTVRQVFFSWNIIGR